MKTERTCAKKARGLTRGLCIFLLTSVFFSGYSSEQDYPPPPVYGPAFGFGFNFGNGYGRGGRHGHSRW